MELPLKQYAGAVGKSRQELRKEMVAVFQITNEQFDGWWTRGKPDITIEVTRHWKIKRVLKGKVTVIERRKV